MPGHFPEYGQSCLLCLLLACGVTAAAIDSTMGALTIFLGSLTWYPTGRLGPDEMSLQGHFLGFAVDQESRGTGGEQFLLC